MSATHQIERDHFTFGVTPVCKRCKYVTSTSVVRGEPRPQPCANSWCNVAYTCVYVDVIIIATLQPSSACFFKTCLSCASLWQLVPVQYSSSSSLHCLIRLPLDGFPSYGVQLMIRDVHRASHILLIHPVQNYSCLLTSDTTFYLFSYPDDPCLSPYVMFNKRLSIFIYKAASLLMICLSADYPRLRVVCHFILHKVFIL